MITQFAIDHWSDVVIVFAALAAAPTALAILIAAATS